MRIVIRIKKLFKRMKKKFYSLLLKLGNFVIDELPFIIIFFCCIVPTTLKDFLANGISEADLKYFSIAFLYSVVFAYLGSKKKYLKIFFYSVGVFLFGIYMFLWLVFGTSISPLIIQLVAETNARETSEFFSAFVFSKGAIITYASIALLIILIIFLEKNWNKIKVKKWLQNSYTAVALGVLSILFLLDGVYNLRIYYTLYKCQVMEEMERWAIESVPFSMDAFTVLAYSMYAPYATMNEIKSAVDFAKDIDRQSLTDSVEDSINVIYILGESFIKSHAALYGYRLKTTPFMDTEQEKGNLVAFNNVVAPFNSTTQVQKNTFCCNSLADGEAWYEAPYFPILFKKAGYKVSLWDIQRDFVKNAFFTFSVNSFIYDKELQKYAYSYTSGKEFQYDGEMVDDFFKSKASSFAKKNLIIFHLLGQHINASDRFPHTKQFCKFSYKDINRNEGYMTKEKKQDIADYDNATLYNDYVIRKIVQPYMDKPTVMVYFSDHGEEIYDYRDSKGRNAGGGGITPNLVKYQYEVPFVIWFSTSFMNKYPKLVNDVKVSKDKPFVTDNVCQILFHLTGMKTNWYKADRDLISPRYIPKKRIIAGVDYDKYVKK